MGKAPLASRQREGRSLPAFIHPFMTTIVSLALAAAIIAPASARASALVSGSMTLTMPEQSFGFVDAFNGSMSLPKTPVTTQEFSFGAPVDGPIGLSLFVTHTQIDQFRMMVIGAMFDRAVAKCNFAFRFAEASATGSGAGRFQVPSLEFVMAVPLGARGLFFNLTHQVMISAHNSSQEKVFNITRFGVTVRGGGPPKG